MKSTINIFRCVTHWAAIIILLFSVMGCEDNSINEDELLLYNSPEDFINDSIISNAINQSLFSYIEGADFHKISDDFYLDATIYNSDLSLMEWTDTILNASIMISIVDESNEIIIKKKKEHFYSGHTVGFISGNSNQFTIWIQDINMSLKTAPCLSLTDVLIITFDKINEKDYDLEILGIVKEIRYNKTVGNWWLASGKITDWYNKFTVLDTRDDHRYKIVEIGSQVWMSENLAFEHENSFYYNSNSSYGEDYGRLYQWDAAMESCPDGWHLPSMQEWNILINKFGGAVVAGGALKEEGTAHWTYPNTGASDVSGLGLLPGGGRNWGWHFIGIEELGFYWTSTQVNVDTMKAKVLFYNSDEIDDFSKPNAYGFSVRCVKD